VGLVQWQSPNAVARLYGPAFDAAGRSLQPYPREARKITSTGLGKLSPMPEDELQGKDEAGEEGEEGRKPKLLWGAGGRFGRGLVIGDTFNPRWAPVI
jgi:hypothetical protein